jgi:hypothetical protein
MPDNSGEDKGDAMDEGLDGVLGDDIRAEPTPCSSSDRTGMLAAVDTDLDAATTATAAAGGVEGTIGAEVVNANGEGEECVADADRLSGEPPLATGLPAPTRGGRTHAPFRDGVDSSESR